MEIRFTVGNISLYLSERGTLEIDQLNDDGNCIATITVASNRDEMMNFHNAGAVLVQEFVKEINFREQQAQSKLGPPAMPQGRPTGPVLH